jgi:DNA anti-recombination protein RmuC
MDNENILKTLAEMEEILDGVKSASEQVNETVAAYAQLGKTFSTYVDSLSSVNQTLKDIISNWNSSNINMKKEIQKSIQVCLDKLSDQIALFSKQCNNISEEYKKETDSAITTFSDKLDEMSQKYINDTNAVVSTLDSKLEKTQKDFNWNVNKTAGEFSAKIDAAKNRFDDLLTKVDENNKKMINSFEDKFSIISEDIEGNQKSTKTYIVVTCIVIVLLECILKFV